MANDSLKASRAAVAYGTLDDNPTATIYSEVALLESNWFDAPTVGYFCTGSLVTPRHILTANHCVTGASSDFWAGGGRERPAYDLTKVKFKFLPGGHKVDEDLGRSDTNYRVAYSGVAQKQFYRIGRPIDYVDANLDVAIIELDRAILPPSSVYPGTELRKVAGLGLVAACPDNVGSNPTVVGFGETCPLGAACAELRKGFRTYRSAGPWEYKSRSVFPGADMWLYDADLVLQGDSGGPLLTTSGGPGVGTGAGSVCGVGSFASPSFWWDIVDPFDFVSPANTQYASVDRGDNRKFVKDVLWDTPKNRLRGLECRLPKSSGWVVGSKVEVVDTLGDWRAATVIEVNAGSASPFKIQLDGTPISGFVSSFELRTNPTLDSDGDGVIDTCDNCPFIKNHDQLDSDNDGIGDVCDNCVFVANKDQVNSNFDAEVEVASTLVSPPCLTSVTGSCRSADVKVSDFFEGDVCDPNPITVVSSAGLSGVTGSPTARTYSVHYSRCAETRVLNASQNNLFVVEGIGAHAVTAPSAGPIFGQTQLAACRCESPDDEYCKTSSRGCDRTVLDRIKPGSALGYWKLMSLSNPDESPALLANKTLATTHQRPFGKPTFDRKVTWNYWEDFVPTAPIPLGDSSYWKGIVWSWVRTYSDDAAHHGESPADPTSSVLFQRKRQRVLHTEMTEVRYPATTDIPCKITRIRPEIPPIPGPDFSRLGDGFRDRLILEIAPPGIPELDGLPVGGSPGTPAPSIPAKVNFRSPSFADMSLDAPSTLGLLTALEGLTVPRLLLETDTPASSREGYLGVILEMQSHSVKHVISDATGSLTTSPVYGQGEPMLPQPNVPTVAAISGARNEVAFFGEVDASGQRGNFVRVYDATTNIRELKPMLGTIRISDPISAAYRAQDDAYYILDKSVDELNQEVFRLLRLPRGLTAYEVARWYPGVATYNEHALTINADGFLVLTSWRNDWVKRYAVATIDLSRGLHVRYKYEGYGVLYSPAFLSRAGLIAASEAPGASASATNWFTSEATDVQKKFGNDASTSWGEPIRFPTSLVELDLPAAGLVEHF